MKYSIHPQNLQVVANSGRPLFLLLLFCGLALFLTMPANVTPGDGYGPRAEAANLVMTGRLGIDYSEREKVADLAANRGAYFFENDAKLKLYSKWGIMNTVFNLPPVLAQKIYAGKVELEDPSSSFLFFINLNNLLLSLICIGYLYKLTSLFEERERFRLLFVVSAVFSTYLWYSLRSHMHELFQLVLFLGFVCHYLSFLRASADEADERRWRQLAWATVWAGLLLLVKPFYLTIFGVVWLFALMAGPPGVPLRERVRHNLIANRVRLALNLLFPTVLLVGLFLMLNNYRFGSPFETGYGQETFEGPEEIGFSLGVLTESLPGFLLLPGNANVFLHFPLLFFGLFGVRSFIKKWPTEAAFLFFMVLSNFLIISCYLTWRGEWTYGPRYLLLFAVIGSLPILETFRMLSEKSILPIFKAFIVILAAVTFWSFTLQVCVNSVYNFTNHSHRYFFEQFHSKEIDDYLNNYLTQGTFSAALLGYKLGISSYYPLDALQRQNPRWYAFNKDRLEKYVKWDIPINYLFLRPWFGQQVNPLLEKVPVVD